MLSTTEREMLHRLWLRRLMELGKTRTPLTDWEQQFVVGLSCRLIDRGELKLSEFQAQRLQDMFDLRARGAA